MISSTAPDSRSSTRNAMLRDELMAALPHLRRLPDRIDRILTLTGRGDLRIRHVVDEDGRRIVRTLVNRALLASIGSRCSSSSAILLVAAEPGPRSPAAPGCSRCSATAGCSPGRSCCCGSWPRSPGTAPRDLLDRDPGRCRDGGAPPDATKPPGERYYRHPGDVVRLVLWGTGIVLARAPRRSSAPTRPTGSPTTRPGRGPAAAAVRELAARAHPGRRARSCRSRSSWSLVVAAVAPARAASSPRARAARRCGSCSTPRSICPAGVPERRHERHLGRVDALPVAPLPRRGRGRRRRSASRGSSRSWRRAADLRCSRPWRW